MFLRTRQNDCDIHYKPGRDMLLADTLSRVYLVNYKPSSIKVEVEYLQVAQLVPVPDHQLKELQKKKTACDPTLQVLKAVVLNGFPDSKE